MSKVINVFIMKFFISNHVLSILVLLVFATSCLENDEFEDPSVRVSVDQVYRFDSGTGEWEAQGPSSQVQTGDSVIFRLDHTSELLAIYTGDSLHAFANSALALVGDNPDEEIYRPIRSDHREFFVDFRRLAAKNEAPANITFEGGTASGVLDSKLSTFAYQLSGTSIDMVVTPGNPLGSENDEADSRTMTLGMRVDGSLGTDTLFVEISMEFDGNDAGITRRTAYAMTVDTDSGIFVNEAALQFYFNFKADLGDFYENWATTNGVALDPDQNLTLSKLTVSFKTPASFGGNVLMKDFKIGQNYYGNFDTGFGVDVTNSGGVEFFDHVYSNPGTYTVTAIGTSVGDKIYDGGGYNDDRNIVDEYDIPRAFSELTLEVFPN